MTITGINGKTKLNNGVEMPYFGLGTWQLTGDEASKAVCSAIDYGYRLIDTAAFYNNEEAIGRAIKEFNVTRNEIFITTKVWNTDQGYDQTLRAYDKSCHLLGVDYADLYLVHWPVTGKFTDTWKALEKIYKEGRVRAIGISNFLQVHLDKLLDKAEIIPAINQIEFHPHLIQSELLKTCKHLGIKVQAWSPIMQGRVFDIPLLKEVGKKYDKNAAQVVLRWDLQRGVLTIPKSASRAHIKTNAEIFDFQLTEEEMSQINSLDCNLRYGYDPMLV
ncbi:MAG: aldo/keto reductase [Bacteroidales bacterium]|nr:aldo/keto reductase [Bacteroidales bacterium]